MTNKKRTILTLEDQITEQMERAKNFQSLQQAQERILRLPDPTRIVVADKVRFDLITSPPPTTDQELWWYIKGLYGIEIPWRATTPDVQPPFHWFSDMYFGRVSFSVGLANRGGSKTYLGSILNREWCKRFPGWNARHAGSTKDQALVAAGYLRDWSLDAVLKTDFLGNPHKYEAYFKNSSYWKILTGSMQGMSGPHPHSFTGDEIEFWPYDALVQSMKMPMDYSDEMQRIWGIFSTRQRCLPHYARIITEDGPQKIGVVVNKKYAGKVKSWNKDTNTWEWKQIVGWHRNGSSKEWIKVYLEYTGLGKGCELIATGDHHVYYDGEHKKPLKEFKVGDTVCVPSWQPSAEQEQILMGTLLGDASLLLNSSPNLRIEHSYKQLGYLEWLTRAIGLPFSQIFNKRRNHYLNVFESNAYMGRIKKDWYFSGKKRIPDYVWEKLGWLGIAVWLMDDGTYRPRGANQCEWQIATHNMDDHEREQAEIFWKKLGFNPKWRPVNRNPNHFILGFNAEDSKRISYMMLYYINVSAHLGKHAGWKTWIAKDITSFGTVGIEQVPIQKIEIVKTPPQGCYDITVEGNHNYCNGSNILVSNSFGTMARMVENADSLKIKKYQWTVFETMQPCKTCIAMDQEPHGTDEAREKVCVLWSYCHGERARKSTGWMKLPQVQEDYAHMGADQFETQCLCMRPSKTGLCLVNFDHVDKPDGNYTAWTFQPELPYYVFSDPAEGKKSVMFFVQIFKDATYYFDEIITKRSANVTEDKERLYERMQKMGYPDPALIIVDPHRSDAVATWKAGTISGEGMNKSFKADMPPIDKINAMGQELAVTYEFLRSRIRDGSGKRWVYVNKDRCPGLVLAIKEHHYPIDAEGNVTSNTPTADFKDEIDAMRYGEMYKKLRLANMGVSALWL